MADLHFPLHLARPLLACYFDKTEFGKVRAQRGPVHGTVKSQSTHLNRICHACVCINAGERESLSCCAFMKQWKMLPTRVLHERVIKLGLDENHSLRRGIRRRSTTRREYSRADECFTGGAANVHRVSHWLFFLKRNVAKSLDASFTFSKIIERCSSCLEEFTRLLLVLFVGVL
jgi:hypothetical protein